MIPNTLGNCAAHFPAASAPIPTDTNGLTFGKVVLKLLAAMRDEKHAPGNEANVRPIIRAANNPDESFLPRAAVIVVSVGPIIPAALAPATASTEMPAVKITAM